MSKNIYFNLPVGNLPKSVEFFLSLGFSKNDAFSNDEGAAIIVDENITIMLVVHPKFLGFVEPGKRALANAHATAGHLMAIQVDTREEVDSIADKALSIGGSEATKTEDYGWMYSRGFADLDGHIWEFFWMDEQAAIAANA